MKALKHQIPEPDAPDFSDLPKAHRPKFADTLRFPADLTALQTENVAELHSMMALMYAYANGRRAEASAEVIRLEAALRLLNAGMFTECPGMAQLQKYQQAIKTESDPRWQRLTVALTKVRQQQEVYTAHMSNYDRFMFVLNRELTRRQGRGDEHYNQDKAFRRLRQLRDHGV